MCIFFIYIQVYIHVLDSSDVPHNVLANYDEDCDIENFIIPELEEKILAAIPGNQNSCVLGKGDSTHARSF